MFIEPDTEEGKERMRQYHYAMQVREDLLKKQKRYGELIILVKHTEEKNKKDYENELKHNIESHIYLKTFLEQHPEVHKILIKEAKNQSHLEEPDLNFAKTMKLSNIN